ncbi:MAG: dTDP-4-dehydrorhamnose reductase [Deltaproteobacteria bacterium]|nr:dTDP-4-dehydrorhamnose reductase [Deltaproteobacteria bacterium]
MKRMLVTGGKGLLGREILDAFAGECEILVTDEPECDVTRAADVRRAMDDFRPAVVVHCAAYTAVDRAEDERDKAFAVNALGTRNVACGCRERGALLVTYGSDYIFDGTKGAPYAEEDEANPLSVYGASKWAAELALREEAPEHLLVRSQWLYGPGGRNFVFTILSKARRGETLRVVSDQVGCPTSAKDLAEGTKRLLSAGARGTFHFSNEGDASWYDFAAFILACALPGAADLRPARSSDLPYPARRPAYSVLSKEKYRRTTGVTPRHWRDAAREFVALGNGAGASGGPDRTTR